MNAGEAMVDKANSVGPRVLLKRLRDLMTEPMEPQERLDRIVFEIAAKMVCEVCSVYVLRADGKLELYATQGLNKEAVHRSQLKIGEGLVGTIAASNRGLNLSDAQNHPAFAYLPETGEEIYNSFLGVPLLRAGRTLGVVVIQNRSKTSLYAEDEVEALETVAMVLAELVASGSLSGLQTTGLELDLKKPVTIHGSGFNEGVGLGHIVLHDPRVVVTNLFAEDSEKEVGRLEYALGALRLSIDDMLARRDVDFEGEHRAVLEAYRMFAHDKGWVRRMEEAIRNGLTAEAAVEKVQSDMRVRMTQMADPYLRERLSDFDDLTNRLMRQLAGGTAGASGNLPKDGIIVARTMGAAELLDYPRENVRGLVLEEGSATSHVVIVARAMGVPVLGQAKGIVSMSEAGDAIIVDGEEGVAHLRPLPNVEAAYAEKVRFRANRQKLYKSLRHAPNVTADGEAFTLMMNAGLLVDLPQLEESGAEGIGLFRTELQFMVASAFPRAEAQEQLYRQVIGAAGSRPVTFRTLDIGGDKALPYMRVDTAEENPALGLRAVRLTLERPALLRTQMRALLKASGGRELRVMLPMVTELSEIVESRKIIQKEVQHLSRHAHDLPTSLKLGAMLEVPVLLHNLDGLMKTVDFVSVGSNDLFQFMMAVDRGNAALAKRYDLLTPAFLRALRSIVRAGKTHGTPVTLCGEMASRTIPALALFAIGYRSISLSASAIGPIKAMLREVRLAEVSEIVNAALNRGETPDIRKLLNDYAAARSLPV
jgi:phosphotransferase system enzyme I (PtsP)